MNSPSLSLRLLFMALIVYVLNACSKEPLPDELTAKISGYNHTDQYIHQFYVDDAWGGNVMPYTGGGSFVCCIVYPRQWRDGLAAKVRWTTSSPDPNATGSDTEEIWHEETVPIEAYKAPGTTLNVHFLPDNKARLVIFSGSDQAEGYPGPRLPKKPKDFKW